jgi:AcrB/AcrD/AcrF family/Transposase domain (DUF772)
MEQLNYNLRYRWFIDLSPDNLLWDPTTFTKNHERLQAGEVFEKFMARLLGHPQVKPPLSDEHFSVDGTLIEAWASQRSFHPRDDSDEKARTSMGKPTGTTRTRMARLRATEITPHVTHNGLSKTGRRRRSAIDGRTTRHTGYAKSQSRRAMIECIFGWGQAAWRSAKDQASRRSPRRREFPAELAFILGVAPLVVATGAGAEMRQSLGTAVFGGMLGVTGFGLIFTPAFYTLVQRIGAGRSRAPAGPREPAREFANHAVGASRSQAGR